jgi:hypothetical protein
MRVHQKVERPKRRGYSSSIRHGFTGKSIRDFGDVMKLRITRFVRASLLNDAVKCVRFM